MDLKKQTGEHLVVWNMLHVYQTINKLRKTKNNLHREYGFLEACVRNFTNINEDMRKCKEYSYKELLYTFSRKNFLGFNIIITESVEDLLMRYAKQYFIDNDIDYQTSIIE